MAQALVEMSKGPDKSMLGDARVSLSSSDAACVEVVANLASPNSWDYRALDSGNCTSATLTATVTGACAPGNGDRNVFRADVCFARH